MSAVIKSWNVRVLLASSSPKEGQADAPDMEVSLHFHLSPSDLVDALCRFIDNAPVEELGSSANEALEHWKSAREEGHTEPVCLDELRTSPDWPKVQNVFRRRVEAHEQLCG